MSEEFGLRVNRKFLNWKKNITAFTKLKSFANINVACKPVY